MEINLIHSARVTGLQKQRTEIWHHQAPQIEENGFYRLVEINHQFNFLLWHEEDKARRDDQGFEFVYRAKRSIDNYNQQRNNAMETMDTWIMQHLKPKMANCPYHSETPGMIIDRLSILALKAYHMAIQTQRTDVDNSHHQTCQQKLTTINLQLQQLADCLHVFLDEIQAGYRTFHVYHQFKMYNDPNLNPQLYQNQHAKN